MKFILGGNGTSRGTGVRAPEQKDDRPPADGDRAARQSGNQEGPAFAGNGDTIRIPLQPTKTRVFSTPESRNQPQKPLFTPAPVQVMAGTSSEGGTPSRPRPISRPEPSPRPPTTMPPTSSQKVTIEIPAMPGHARVRTRETDSDVDTPLEDEQGDARSVQGGSDVSIPLEPVRRVARATLDRLWGKSDDEDSAPATAAASSNFTAQSPPAEAPDLPETPNGGTEPEPPRAAAPAAIKPKTPVFRELHDRSEAPKQSAPADASKPPLDRPPEEPAPRAPKASRAAAPDSTGSAAPNAVYADTARRGKSDSIDTERPRDSVESATSFGTSTPEEVYFRGFLDTLKDTIRVNVSEIPIDRGVDSQQLTRKSVILRRMPRPGDRFDDTSKNEREAVVPAVTLEQVRKAFRLDTWPEGAHRPGSLEARAEEAPPEAVAVTPQARADADAFAVADTNVRENEPAATAPAASSESAAPEPGSPSGPEGTEVAAVGQSAILRTAQSDEDSGELVPPAPEGPAPSHPREPVEVPAAAEAPEAEPETEPPAITESEYEEPATMAPPPPPLTAPVAEAGQDASPPPDQDFTVAEEDDEPPDDDFAAPLADDEQSDEADDFAATLADDEQSDEADDFPPAEAGADPLMVEVPDILATESLAAEDDEPDGDEVPVAAPPDEAEAPAPPPPPSATGGALAPTVKLRWDGAEDRGGQDTPSPAEDRPASTPGAAPRNGQDEIMLNYTHRFCRPAISVCAVVFSVVDETLRILLQQRQCEPGRGCWELPSVFLAPGQDLDTAAMDVVAPLGITHDEPVQLLTRGAADRDPRGRILAVAYRVLTRDGEAQVRTAADGSLLSWFPVNGLPPMAFDHEQVIMAARTELRREVRREPSIFALLPDKFTLGELQTACEAVLDETLDKRNFCRKMKQCGVLRELAEHSKAGGRRPARLYAYNRRGWQEGNYGL